MSRKINILVVDDDEDTLKVIESSLSTEGYIVDTFSSPTYALQRLQEKNYDTILVDFQMPEINGEEFLKKARKADKDVPVILFTGYATVAKAVEAMKDGAYHYLTKPLNYDDLKIVLKNSITLRRLRNSYKNLEQEIQKTYNLCHLIGKSKVMKKILTQVEIAAKSSASVLIHGEKGTGKSTIARAIHFQSKEEGRPFVSVQCSALGMTFTENQLFEKVDQADGGTLFLEQVQDLHPDMQTRLLQIFEEKDLIPVEKPGTSQPDVRIISATSIDLEKAVKEQKFQEELFYLINTFPIVVPPLRERREDISPLAQHFLKECAQKHQKNIENFSPAVYAGFLSYDFPGNVSELENLIERACLVCQSQFIEPEDIPWLFPDDAADKEDPLSAFAREKKKIIDKFERQYLISLLTATKGRIGKASKISGLAERNIYDKMHKYGIKKEDFKTR